MFAPNRKIVIRLPLLSVAATSALLYSDVGWAADLIDHESVAIAAPSRTRVDAAWSLLHDWKVVVGAGASFQPKYEGGDEFEISPVPFASIQPYDWLTINPAGVNAEVLTVGSATFDLNVGYDSGRSEDDADILRGMGDIDFGATIGGKANYSLGPADFFLSAEKTIGGSDGLLATAGVGVTHPVTDRLILAGDASVTFGDENYMMAYFGVDAAQSQRSGHARYDAGAGIKSVNLSASATYLVTENWFVRGEQSVEFLMGDAVDSPIVETEIVPKTMLIVGYKF